MPTVVVISQPMLWPWVGLLEQIKLSNAYIHYDDVQFPTGRSFMNRVQVKTAQGIQWLTIPVKRGGKQFIKDMMVDSSQEWRKSHKKTLQRAYGRCPHYSEMMDLVERVYAVDSPWLIDYTIASVEELAAFFDLCPRFLRSSSFGFSSTGSEHLLDILESLEADVYVTGHGARNYLDHESFEKRSIDVQYMKYDRKPYPQAHDEFTPYVSGLDLVANMGRAGAVLIASGTVGWKEFINESQ